MISKALTDLEGPEPEGVRGAATLSPLWRISSCRSSRGVRRFAPGIGLCGLIAGFAYLLQVVEEKIFGQPYIEALVLAILIGVAVRTIRGPSARFRPGIEISAKLLLEIAVALLGATVSVQAVLAIGPAMIAGIAATVVVAIGASFTICRALCLDMRLAILIACGNSICGNSAIAAVAPVIGADGDDVAASIAFTAVLGVAVVLLLPLLVPVLSLSVPQYGALAGLTVYAVPQVLAATLPIGALANQVGTVVKLVRVLMLGPVVLLMSVLAGRLRDQPDEATPSVTAGDRPARGRLARGRPPLRHLLPWFIVGFVVIALLRTFGLIPTPLLKPAAFVATQLTVVSMAALGLGVDVRSVASAGLRVTSAVILSLLVLGAISLGLLHAVKIG